METVKAFAYKQGADIVSILNLEPFSGQAAQEKFEKLLPGAKTLVILGIGYLDGVWAAPTRLAVENCRQIDLELGRLAQKVGRFLEKRGSPSLPLAAYYPMEMTAETRGLVGDISLKDAAAAAGMGEIGRNNLLLTPDFGPRVRLSSVLTRDLFEEAVMPTSPRRHIRCDDCSLCMDHCPAGAIGEKQFDLKACLKTVASPYGLGELFRYISGMIGGKPDEIQKKLRDPAVWNFYQNFMVGAYFNCLECQRICPVGMK